MSSSSSCDCKHTHTNIKDYHYHQFDRGEDEIIKSESENALYTPYRVFELGKNENENVM